VRALASPASLKGVLSAGEAAAALARGLRRAGAEAEESPLADGGEGTAEVLGAKVMRVEQVHDAFGRPRPAPIRELADGTVVVESAEVVPLDPERLDVLAATSRGLGELLSRVSPCPRLLVCLGGTANVDGGAGLLQVLDELPAPTRVACDVDVPLVDAARLFSSQKGASSAEAAELEARLAAMPALAPYADAPGAGAAGGLGAALASLGAELLPGAPLVLDLVGFEATGYDLVVTGEGTVDRTTLRGKAPGEVARRCAAAGVRCIVFGGRVAEGPSALETIPLSGDPNRATSDLVDLGRLLREAKAE